MIDAIQIAAVTRSRSAGFASHARYIFLSAMVFGLTTLWGQNVAAQEQGKTSITDSLKRADEGKVQLHIFYVHGMGIDPPKGLNQDFKVSEDFRDSLCKLLHCISEYEGRYYANQFHFDPNHGYRPPLKYLGSDIWKNEKDWLAAAPFVDNYRLVRKNKKTTTIYLHEINWWPLVLSAKCRQIVAKDAELVDRDNKHSAVCSAKTELYNDQRYKAYTWITPDEVESRKAGWPRAAVVNRWLKHDILDWGFADALLAVGPLHKHLVEGIREVVLESFTPTGNQEFIIVSHSLGSYLMFSALDFQNESEPSNPRPRLGEQTALLEAQRNPPPATLDDWKKRFADVLRNTTHAYFMANQLRLLELANLDETADLMKHLQNWSDLRQPAHAYIVAFSDPDDLLTWKVPKSDQVRVKNLPSKNAWRVLRLFANPYSAHTGYDKNKAVVREMVPKRERRALE